MANEDNQHPSQDEGMGGVVHPIFFKRVILDEEKKAEVTKRLVDVKTAIKGIKDNWTALNKFGNGEHPFATREKFTAVLRNYTKGSLGPTPLKSNRLVQKQKMANPEYVVVLNFYADCVDEMRKIENQQKPNLRIINKWFEFLGKLDVKEEEDQPQQSSYQPLSMLFNWIGVFMVAFGAFVFLVLGDFQLPSEPSTLLHETLTDFFVGIYHLYLTLHCIDADDIK